MNVSMNQDWARFKALGVARLGRAGFAEWLEHAAAVMRVEAKREAAQREAEAATQHRCAHGIFCPHHEEEAA